MRKILIIKLGHSETLDPEIGKFSSLGDVLRTTVILHAFKEDRVTWLVDEVAYPLLRGNPYINRILFYDLTTVLQIGSEKFDIVVNLEKAPGICALADKVEAWTRYGFRFDYLNGKAESHEHTHEILKIYNDIDAKRLAERTWQDVLYEMIGQKWDNEEYILGYKPKTETKYGIGLNYKVGAKWPNKSWPIKDWHDLGAKLEDAKYLISPQLEDTDKDIEKYIDWINSCQLIVTNDSLGLHIAIALEKKVIALFGPTSPYETYLYGLGTKILPSEPYVCIPCLKHSCHMKIACMETIEVEGVFKEIKEVFASERDYSSE